MSITEILFSFEGRIPRRVFWFTGIAMCLCLFALLLLCLLAFGPEATDAVALIANIPMIWISLAVQAKRWHDVDKSGFWILINFVPLIGPIWALIENGFVRGTVGANAYGLDPT